jgi:GTP-binding protein
MWKNLQDQLDGLISWYLEERTNNIKAIVILIDSKLGAQQTDIDMYKYLLDLELPVKIVLSKIDKIWKNEVNKSLNHAKNTFFGQEIIPVSSTKKLGIDELKKSLKKALLS